MFRLPLSQMGLWERARDILSAHSQDSVPRVGEEVTGRPGGAGSLPTESPSCTANFPRPTALTQGAQRPSSEESAEPVNLWDPCGLGEESLSHMPSPLGVTRKSPRGQGRSQETGTKLAWVSDHSSEAPGGPLCVWVN